mmetsp:Transcript_17647/g.41501  ORF Transcript_17647/g.41501 Transcript_17647/m.41501 type:complete len:230 (-) Transcript_17647:185-874(-)
MNFEAGRYTKGWFMFGRAKHPNPPRQLFGPAVTSPKYSPPTPMIPSQNVLLQEASILVTWQLSHQDRSKRQWIVAFERMRGARPCQREEDCFGVREPPIRVGREVLGWPSPCVGNLFAVGPGKPFIASFFLAASGLPSTHWASLGQPHNLVPPKTPKETAGREDSSSGSNEDDIVFPLRPTIGSVALEAHISPMDVWDQIENVKPNKPLPVELVEFLKNAVAAKYKSIL